MVFISMASKKIESETDPVEKHSHTSSEASPDGDTSECTTTPKDIPRYGKCLRNVSDLPSNSPLMSPNVIEKDQVEDLASSIVSPSDEYNLQREGLLTSYASPVLLKDNALQNKLLSLDLKQGEIEFILEQGEKFMERPAVLAAKLKVSQDKAKLAIEALKTFKKQQTILSISQCDISKIEQTMTENPQFDNTVDIALLCDIDEDIVSAYLKSKPLNDRQKAVIGGKVNVGYSIGDIANILKLSELKVREYVENTFLTFEGKEGVRMLGTINEYFPEISSSKLRTMIISNDLALQDKLGCILKKKNIVKYQILQKYFARFEESKTFFEINLNLSVEDIILIEQLSHNSIEELSSKLNKVETVIKDYLEQYSPSTVVRKHCVTSQRNQILKIVNSFGKERITFQTYRMIISNSFKEIISGAEQDEQVQKNVFDDLLPLAFYYLKCSLPLDDITQIIANTSKINLTTHDMFHILFQLSEPVLRGYCIEHYSFSNPVPLYYPNLNGELEICKELWYSLQEFNGLVSFGLGRAGWNPIGKSYLIDFIFGTDFVRGNPQTGAFHFSSIDIQLTKNLFGDKASDESTKWAYIDCHGHSDLSVINIICQQLDIALIHVSYLDYSLNRRELNKDLDRLTGSVKYVFQFIRDCEDNEVKIEQELTKNQSVKRIFIPNLTKSKTNNHSIKKSLKEIGYEIIHLRYDNPKCIRDSFLENVIGKLDPNYLEELRSDKQLIQLTINLISSNFSLPYYPLFVSYMSCYHRASAETDQKKVDKLNVYCTHFSKELKRTRMGEVVVHFNEILKKKNSTFILWKLSQELSILSKQMKSPIKEQKNDLNDLFKLEIIWREALLSYHYGGLLDNNKVNSYLQLFVSNFSNHVERGEPFELIDGDNLRFFNKEIDYLLFHLYDKQFEELERINEGQTFPMKQAPIVVSIFGPQSSGKSTLLNYCFGCKFLTSAGRCTKGIYGSLSRLSRPVNLSNYFLILDTEGLDAIERGNIKDTSHIHFDRTMVLFCMAVSQVVIINVIGNIGTEMQNLLQVCAYSLSRLKVTKVPAPKIFFVLNQQADPDPDKHLDSMNILINKLNEQPEFVDTEGVKIFNLIQVSKENLFILPSAFNSEQINKPGGKLFDSEVTKLSPTITFADKCADLRMAIINQLANMPVGQRATFDTMNQWIEMSGTIWDTIIKYQDIVKYRNVEEEICSNILGKIVSELMETNIYLPKHIFLENTKSLLLEINAIDTLSHPNLILTNIMIKFDDVFNQYQDRCFAGFDAKCQTDPLLKKMSYVCNEPRLNLSRLVYMERKIYEDRLKFEIKAVLTEIKLSESMKKFQEIIIENVDKYLDFNVEELKIPFEETWEECFGCDDQKEEEIERDENFNDLYSMFRMESKTMENCSAIFEIFRELDFKIDDSINALKSDICTRFQTNIIRISGPDQFIFPCGEINFPIKEMTPYPGLTKCQYFGKNSLFVVKHEKHKLMQDKPNLIIHDWVPKKCQPLVKYCSGYYNHPEINWGKLDQNSQILLLASELRSPDNFFQITWEKLVDDITSEVQSFIQEDPFISHGTVKEIINFLCTIFKLVNYEINYIGARLTNTAERTITTLVFIYAFKSLWDTKTKVRIDNKEKTKEKKAFLLHYLLQKIENRRIVRGSWDRKKMRESDLKFATSFALNFIGCVERRLKTVEQPIIEDHFRARKYFLSYENILFLAYSNFTTELSMDEAEVMYEGNSVVQYICNRNKVFYKSFQDLWSQVESELYKKINKDMNEKFTEQTGRVIRVLNALLTALDAKCSGGAEQKAFDSDSNFEIADIESCRKRGADFLIKAKESPFKSAILYLRMYFDPRVSSEEFNHFFSDAFVLDGVIVKRSDTYVLCDKPTNPSSLLDEDLFKKLENTKMFNTENIFNLFEYITEFLSVLNTYNYQLTYFEYSELIQHIKEEFGKDALGCPSRCPSCGKLCERELHPNNGKCQIKTGHQICSMGGGVWNNDEEKTAVLFICDDYKDDTRVNFSGKKMNWKIFKHQCENSWNWDLPNEEKYLALQNENRQKMIDTWNKYGKGILNYHDTRGTKIKFIPYTSYGELAETLNSKSHYICFVIDGTSSMFSDIKKARISVGQFISKYNYLQSEFKVVIYRDHCDEKIIEQFPPNSEFTPHYESVQQFLKAVKAYGGGDYPEAVLDGLATATTKCDWKISFEVKNIIIHLFDAPPHGDFPNYESHLPKSNKKHCCCCNHGTLCKFEWNRDVWDNMKKFNIHYHGINTGKHFPEFEAAMKHNLGDLCGKFQFVGKEVVNEAILQIFIDHNVD